MSTIDRIIQAAVDKATNGSATMRFATVTAATNTGTGIRLTVNLDGQTISSIPCAGTIVPAVGSGVWLLHQGSKMIAFAAPNPQSTYIGPDTIGSEQLIAGSVTTDAIAANAVAIGKLAAGAVDAAALADNSVNTAKIAANAVAAGKIAANAVDVNAIADGAVGSAKIADAAIITAKIADAAIGTAKIADAAINNAKIANIDAGKITTGTLDANRIAADSITASQIAAKTITAAEIAAGAITAVEIAAGTITAANIKASTITGDKIAAGTIEASNIKAGTITGDRLVAGTVTADKIATNTITASQLTADAVNGLNIYAGSLTVGSGAVAKTSILANGQFLFESSSASGQIPLTVRNTQTGAFTEYYSDRLGAAVAGGASGPYRIETSALTVAGSLTTTGTLNTASSLNSSTSAALILRSNAGATANQIIVGTGSYNTARAHWAPAVDNTYSLGLISPQLRWSVVYAASSSIVTSDERHKTDVVTLDAAAPLGLEFIARLRPVQFRMVDGGNRIVTDEHGEPTFDADGDHVLQPKQGVRPHTGFVAQEVRAAFLAAGAPDWAGWSLADPDNPDSLQALRYEELIAPLVASVQALLARVEHLESLVEGS